MTLYRLSAPMTDAELSRQEWIAERIAIILESHPEMTEEQAQLGAGLMWVMLMQGKESRE